MSDLSFDYESRSPSDGDSAGDEARTNSTDSSEHGFYRNEQQASEPDATSLYTGKAKNNKNDLKSKIKAQLKKRTTKTVVIGGGAGSLVTLFFILILVIGAFKIPDLMQNIELYEFVRTTQDLQNSAQKVTEEDMAEEAASSTESALQKNEYDTAADSSTSSLWETLQRYNPSKVLDNLKASDDVTFNFNYSVDSWGKKRLVGGTVGDTEYTVDEVDGLGRWVPGLRGMLRAQNEAVTREQMISDILDSEQLDNVATIVKGKVFINLYREEGGNLSGWILARFKGSKPDGDMTTQQAQNEASLQTEEASQEGVTVPDNASTSEIEDQVNETENDINAAEQSPSAVNTIVKSAGIDEPAEAAQTTANLFSDVVSGAAGIINPLYKVALPVCIVYDGSVINSGPPIANQTAEQEDIFDHLAAVADQEKQGDLSNKDDTELANAVKGTNAELGNIDNSVPMVRADGGTVNTSGVPSVEAGSDGTYAYSLFNVFGIPPSAASFLNGIVEPMCKTITNPYVAIGTGLGLLAVTSGADLSFEEGIADGIISYVEDVGTNLASRFTSALSEEAGVADSVTEVSTSGKIFAYTRALGRIAVDKAVDTIGDVISAGGAIAGATLLAHIMVSARSGEANNGFAQGGSLANEADSGANIQANEVERSQLFGRTLTTPEIGQSLQETNTLIGKVNASKSTYQRYFSLANADSLLSHIGLSLSEYVQPSVISSFVSLCANLFNPTNYIKPLLALSGKASAAVNPLDQVYGNVQFGWTKSEYNTMNNNASYFPLENQKILSDSGQERAIAQKYSICFGYKYDSNGDGSLNPTDHNGDLRLASAGTEPGSLASLLTKEDIYRDSNGNVIANEGLCSPDNLGQHNPIYGNLVFRWRLAMNYDTTLSTLINEQTITP